MIILSLEGQKLPIKHTLILSLKYSNQFRYYQISQNKITLKESQGEKMRMLLGPD